MDLTWKRHPNIHTAHFRNGYYAIVYSYEGWIARRIAFEGARTLGVRKTLREAKAICGEDYTRREGD